MANGFLLQMPLLAVMKKKVFVVSISQFFKNSHPYLLSSNSEVRARRLSCRKQVGILSECFYYYQKNCKGLTNAVPTKISVFVSTIVCLEVCGK